MTPLVYFRFDDASQGVATPEMLAALDDLAAQIAARGYPPINLTRDVQVEVGGSRVHLRRLNPEHPADQREVWRLAALALGAGEEEALGAVLLRSLLGDWRLVTWCGRALYARPRPVGWWSNDADHALGRRYDRTEATRRLAAHVWPASATPST